jgi:hypothetical protein
MKYIIESKISEEELQDKGKKMKEFYIPEEDIIKTIYYDDEIYEILDILNILDLFIDRAMIEGYHIL